MRTVTWCVVLYGLRAYLLDNENVKYQKARDFFLSRSCEIIGMVAVIYTIKMLRARKGWVRLGSAKFCRRGERVRSTSIPPRKLFKLVATREFSAFYLFHLNEIVRKNCSNFRKPSKRIALKSFSHFFPMATYSLNRITEANFYKRSSENSLPTICESTLICLKAINLTISVPTYQHTRTHWAKEKKSFNFS